MVPGGHSLRNPCQSKSGYANCDDSPPSCFTRRAAIWHLPSLVLAKQETLRRIGKRPGVVRYDERVRIFARVGAISIAVRVTPETATAEVVQVVR